MSDSLRPHGLQHARLPLFFTVSWSLLKLMSTESVMPSNHLTLYHPLLLTPSVFPSTTKETLPRWCSDKESICQCRRHKRHGFYHCVGKIPWRRKWQLTPVFLPGKPHGQRSLTGYCPWSCKELTHLSTRTRSMICVMIFYKGHNKIKGDAKAERVRDSNCLWANWHGIS